MENVERDPFENEKQTLPPVTFIETMRAKKGPPCWEVMQCGRIPDGNHVDELGICPAYPYRGWSCWRAVGTLCGGVVQGEYASKMTTCQSCSHYQRLAGRNIDEVALDNDYFAEVMRTIVVGIFTISRDGVIGPRCSAFAQRLLGLDIEDRRFVDLVFSADEDKVAFGEWLEFAFQSHRIVRWDDGIQQRCPLREKKIRNRWYMFIFTPFYKDDALARVLVQVLDITARKEIELQMAHSQKLETIGCLAAGLAHEINTPIQFINDNLFFLKDAFMGLARILDVWEGICDFVRAEAKTPELMESVNAIREELEVAFLRDEIPVSLNQTIDGAERIAEIVRALKDFSHPGHTGKALFDLHKAIEESIIIGRHEWKRVAVMETRFAPDMPLVMGVASDINQVLLNLIVNAAHAVGDALAHDSTRDKGTIVVETRHDGAWFEIRIADTGTGIPEDVQPRIFEPFYTTKEVGKGTGQGLAIAHFLIVKKHHGSLAFETQAGRGTTFIVRLPKG